MSKTSNRLQGNRARHGGLSVRISPLRRREDPQRIELIGEVVDAYARLRESVLRFVVTLAGKQPDVLLADGIQSQRFDVLLSVLADYAAHASFRRLPELKRVIARARLAEQHRDLIFVHAPVGSYTVLRKVAEDLERLDTEFVGLCVEHVLERRASAVPVQTRGAMGLAQVTN